MAALTLSAFRGEFPEFDEASDPLIQAKLDQAHRSFDEALFGARYLDAVRYKTADLVASSPFGKSMRLAKGEGATVYASSLEAIVRTIPASGLAIE